MICPIVFMRLGSMSVIVLFGRFPLRTIYAYDGTSVAHTGIAYFVIIFLYTVKSDGGTGIGFNGNGGGIMLFEFERFGRDSLICRFGIFHRNFRQHRSPCKLP